MPHLPSAAGASHGRGQEKVTKLRNLFRLLFIGWSRLCFLVFDVIPFFMSSSEARRHALGSQLRRVSEVKSNDLAGWARPTPPLE